MPLFEIGDGVDLTPFRQVQAGADLYESEIEELVWKNLESFTGVALFPVARQARDSTGSLVIDILALDKQGQPYVIEVKRDVDRKQLAQCLEYAGWIRKTSLDEVSALFAGGSASFFEAWQEFTGTDTPIVIAPTPQLILVAKDFMSTTESALEYLIQSGFPVTLLRTSVYEDVQGRRFINIDSEHEVELVGVAAPGVSQIKQYRFEGRRAELGDLLNAGLLRAGTELSWHRPRLDELHRARVTERGEIELENGQAYGTPSRAAQEAAGLGSVDGWNAWKTGDGKRLSELRSALLAAEKE